MRSNGFCASTELYIVVFGLGIIAIEVDRLEEMQCGQTDQTNFKGHVNGMVSCHLVVALTSKCPDRFVPFTTVTCV